MKTQRIDAYIGCSSLKYSDKDFTVDKILKSLCDGFTEMEIGFSVTAQTGGYRYKNGIFTVEDSVKLSVIGEFKKEDIEEFTKAVKNIFNQESLILVEQEIDVIYL